MKVDVKKKESNKTCGLLTHSVLSNLIKRKKFSNIWAWRRRQDRNKLKINYLITMAKKYFGLIFNAFISKSGNMISMQIKGIVHVNVKMFIC